MSFRRLTEEKSAKTVLEDMKGFTDKIADYFKKFATKVKTEAKFRTTVIVGGVIVVVLLVALVVFTKKRRNK